MTPLHFAGELAGLGLAPRTILHYRSMAQRAETWCIANGLDLDTIPAPDVARYAETLPLTFSSRTALRCSLKHYWSVIGRCDPPLRAVRVPPQPTGVCRAVEPGDARILAKSARSRGDDPGLAVCLGLYQGLRRAEIAACRWDAFDEPGWVTVVGKGAKTRRNPLHPTMAALLAATDRRSAWLFPGNANRPHVAGATVWTWVRRVCDDAGVPLVPPHVLRHTCLATANDATGDLRATQAFAGHSRPETTSQYTRATSTRLRALVAALDY
jgi:integrase/recombinase XerC